MKKLLLFIFLLSISFSLFGQKIENNSKAFFYENKGQVVDQKGKENSKVKYLFNSPGLNVQLKNEGFSYDVYEVKRTLKKEKKQKKDAVSFKEQNLPEYDHNYQYHRIDIDFVNGNTHPEIIAKEQSADYDNYYNIPGKPEGVTEVHRFEKLIYENLYPNIDLVFFKPDDTLKPVEYNFIINPGGKISDIRLKFKGAKTKLKEGKISMKLRFGEMHENVPESWIEEPNGKKNIKINFKNISQDVYGFESSQDTFDNTVIIDPVPTRVWGTYFSGSYYDNESAFIVADKNDQVYFGGKTTNPTNIATAGAHQTTMFDDTYDNGFVQKFAANGKRIWGTYIGNLLYTTTIFDGIVNDQALYIGGSTFDKTGTVNNITTPGVHKQFASANTREAFIMKLDFNGQRIWGTYYGGTGYEDIYDLNFDQSGNILVAGSTDSDNQISTPNSYISTNPKNSAGFFAQFSEQGQLLFGSYFYRAVNHITADSQNNIIIAGQYYDFSMYPNIGTPGTHQPSNIGGQNGYILKFDSSFNKLWGTYFGGSFTYSSNPKYNNFIAGLSTDKNDNIIIAGTTRSKNNIATAGAFKEFHNTDVENGFIAKFLPNGSINWSTYYGSEGYFGNNINALFVNENGDIYVAGDTRSISDIATPNGYQPKPSNSDDGYFSKFSSSGSQIWGTYYADMGQDELQKITYKNNHVYVLGYTTGYNFTHLFGTPGTFMPIAYGGYFLAKFRDCQNNVSATVNANVCPGSDIRLVATGGTTYSWTGPNGFTSASPNPTIVDASPVHSGTYICVISGTGDCDGSYSVTVKVEDITAPIPNIANLPNITGNCTTIISAIPMATDYCAGHIIGTTTDPLQYSLPGNYIVQWKYDDGNGNTSIQNQNVIITSEPLPSANSLQTFCLIDQPTISDIVISGTAIKWYDAAGNSVNSNTILIDGVSYFATQTVNGCESLKKEIVVTVNDPNSPSGNLTQDFCSAQNPTISNIIVTGQNIKWYDNLGNLLITTTPLVDGQIYYATQTVNGCESTKKLAVKVIVTNGGIPAKDHVETFCNDSTSNTKIENLNNYKENLIADTANYRFDFFDANNQVVPNPANVNLNIGSNLFNVKVSNSLGCFVIVKLTLTLNPKPILNLPTEVEFCNGQTATIDAGNGFSSYEWTKDNSPAIISTDQILVVSEAGRYFIKVKNNFGCENSTIINVTQSVIATIVGIQIVNSSATVQMSNSGDFEYSLDNVIWQTSNTFKNLSNGSYTVFVKTKLGCIIGSMNFSIFTISNAFTPNADGSNDTWKIAGLENYPGSEIQVFDRFGNLVLQKITNGTFEWDGFSNSRVLPTGNYWYVVKVSDGRLLNGWVLIKNRN